MLKKTNRLAKTKDVELALKKGRGFFNPCFNLKFAPNREGGLRFTVVVSAKVSKKAVARNRLKRIIREFIRLRLARFVSGDYVIMLKPRAVQVAEAEVLANLENLCREKHLFVS